MSLLTKINNRITTIDNDIKKLESTPMSSEIQKTPMNNVKSNSKYKKSKKSNNLLDKVNKKINEIDKQISVIENETYILNDSIDNAISCLYQKGPKGGIYRKTKSNNKIYINSKKYKPPKKCLLNSE